MDTLLPTFSQMSLKSIHNLREQREAIKNKSLLALLNGRHAAAIT